MNLLLSLYFDLGVLCENDVCEDVDKMYIYYGNECNCFVFTLLSLMTAKTVVMFFVDYTNMIMK